MSLHPNYPRDWGIVMQVDAATSDQPCTLHVAMLDQAFDDDGEAIEAEYTGPTLFEGMKIEEDYRDRAI